MPRSVDLLADPVITVRGRRGRSRSVSLPALLAELAADADIVSFPALRHHQEHAWHAFLVQLAAMACHGHGDAEAPLPTSPSRWEELLLGLADGERGAYSLVEEDLSKPAFFQPPVPEGTLRKFDAVPTPDALDVLVTSKNHDLKAARASHATPEHWLFALVSLQTMEGYSGRDNHGIVRMNGGYGSRPCVAVVESLAPASRFRRDVSLLLEGRDRITSQHGYRPSGGIRLMWLLPWDGSENSAVPLASCDPYFLEVCRRVRLTGGAAGLQAWRTSTAVRRVLVPDGSPESSGDCGDPWTPVDRTAEPPKALSVTSAGWTYRLVHELLLEDRYERPLAATPLDPPPEAGAILLLSVLARGQGKTEGYHKRVLPIPARALRLLAVPSDRERISRRSKRQIEDADTVRRKVLHPALCALLQGRTTALDLRDGRTDRWTSELDSEVDARFFEYLWLDLERTDSAAQRRWAETLLRLARAQVWRAIRGAPVPHIRRYRAEAAAWRVFFGSARKHFPELSLSQEQGRRQP